MIELVSYGTAARASLVAAIARAKGGNALMPATVIVPTNYAGLSIRRRLAEGGLVNVRFQVAARTAELLGGARLAEAGRRPLVPWLRREAIRAALVEEPGMFRPAARHPATIRQLARAFDDLAEASEETLDRLASSGQRPTDVVRIFRRVRDLTSSFYDERDLLLAAAAAVEAGDAASEEAGALILYLPRRAPGPLVRLLVAARNGPGAHAILGLTGEAGTDALAREMAGRLAGVGPIQEPESVTTAAATLVASIPDPEEEVRQAARSALAMAAEGTPLHRMAIVFEQPERYALLAHEALTAAGLPHNGPPIRRLAQSLAGRALSGAYRAAGSRFRRDTVMDWLTSAPIVEEGGRAAPGQAWDRISREAGVVRGASQWESRLEGWARAQEKRGMEAETGQEYHRGQAELARRMARFAADMTGRFAGNEPKAPSAHAREAADVLKHYLPRATVERLSEGGEAEGKAWDEVLGLIAAISESEGLFDPVFEAAITRAEFVRVIDEVLDAGWGRVGALGEGIFVGPIATAAEMEFDAVFVIGMSEGNGGRDEDPIITEAERQQAGGAIPSRRMQATHRRRAFLATLAGARRATLSYPRADLRGQKELLPSRWLQEGASTLAGEALYASDIAKFAAARTTPEWFTSVHSFEAVLRSETERASLQERDLASLLSAGERPEEHFLAGEIDGLADGLSALRSRNPLRDGSAAQLDGWNGLVPAGSVLPPGSDQPVSPTALETFAACPFRYLLKHVLRVGEAERPEEADAISAADIGNVMHDALEEFFNGTKGRPDPSAPWSEEEREQMRTIAERHCQAAEDQGLTGKSVVWASERQRILRNLELFLEKEQEQRLASGFVFDRAELAFGGTTDGELPAARLALPDGTALLFRGRIDRVDRNGHGELLISDYKSGSTSKYGALKKPEPEAQLHGGRLLQLPVYALAIEGEATGGPVQTRYWFVTEREGFEERRITFDEAMRTELGRVAQVLVETMQTGHFPAVPETGRGGQCEYCPYDSLCPSIARAELWEQWQQDPEIAGFVALHGGSQGGDSDGG